MKKFDYKNFNKRYNRFKKANLPAPFFDEERQTFEYVFYNGKKEEDIRIHNNIISALEDITTAGFYYSFSNKHFTMEKGDKNPKITFGHMHEHTFEDVVKSLYDFPESFTISKDEEEYYSKQELKYLRLVQKYLLFVGLKDRDTLKRSLKRYTNKKQLKYKNAYIIKQTKEEIENILNNNLNYRVINWYPERIEETLSFKSGENQALFIDDNYDFKMFVEYTKSVVMNYKDIKDKYTIKGLKNTDKVIALYFKVLERF